MKKTSKSGELKRGILGEVSGRVDFLRIDKTGRIYWIDPTKKRKTK